VPKLVLEKKLPTFLENVLTEVDGDVGVVKVFRPEVKNALSKATIQEIGQAIAAFQANDAIKGVVLTSYDGALAGADIGELAALKSVDACRETCLASHPIFERIAHATKPVIAAVDGPVLGGGAEISMACHARVVGKNLAFGQPEVNLGIIPGYGGTQRLPRLIGLQRAVELLRTAKTVTAKDACAWGWAHGEPQDHPLAAAKALVRDVAAGKVKLTPMNEGPMDVPASLGRADIGHRSLAIDAILVDVLREGLKKPLAEGLTIEAEGFGRCKKTVDMDIGMKNFIQNGPRVPAAFLHE
jgi:enoyl-CoA hydratase/carnithine racemase